MYASHADSNSSALKPHPQCYGPVFFKTALNHLVMNIFLYHDAVQSMGFMFFKQRFAYPRFMSDVCKLTVHFLRNHDLRYLAMKIFLKVFFIKYNIADA